MITFLLKMITYERKKCSLDVLFAMGRSPFIRKTEFEGSGEEMIKKEVRQSEDGGRAYLPPSG